MIQKEYDFFEISSQLAELEKERRRSTIYHILETKNSMLTSLSLIEKEAQCCFNEFLVATEFLATVGTKQAVAQGKDAYKEYQNSFQKLKSSIVKQLQKMDFLEDQELFRENPYQDVIYKTDYLINEARKVKDSLKEDLQKTLLDVGIDAHI